jgi:hypothetical protein
MKLDFISQLLSKAILPSVEVEHVQQIQNVLISNEGAWK